MAEDLNHGLPRTNPASSQGRTWTRGFLISFKWSFSSTVIQIFRERLSEKVHATIPKGIVGSFEFTLLQRNLKEWHEMPMEICLRVLKENNKRRFDSYSIRNSVLIISHITFRYCCVHIFPTTFLKIAVYLSTLTVVELSLKYSVWQFLIEHLLDCTVLIYTLFVLFIGHLMFLREFAFYLESVQN